MRNTSDGGKLNPNYSARWKSPGGAKENFRFNNNLMIVRVSWEIYFSKSPENVRIFTFFAAVFAWIEWDWSWKINPHPIPTLHSKAVIALFYMTGYFDVFSIIFIDKEKIKKKLSFFFRKRIYFVSRSREESNNGINLATNFQHARRKIVVRQQKVNFIKYECETAEMAFKTDLWVF